MMRAEGKQANRQPGNQAGEAGRRLGAWLSSAPSWRFGLGSGFTLVEMLVSLAVLALALSIIGYVFTTTATVTRTAAAYSEAHNWLRQYMEQIEEDLQKCDPANSVLVIVGRTQAAARTQAELGAGKYYRVLTGNPTDSALSGYDPVTALGLDPNGNYSDPRADILMFFSNREVVSQAPPASESPVIYGAGAKFSPIQVVYGHAALAQPVVTTDATGDHYGFPANTALRHIDQIDAAGNTNPSRLSFVPLARWELARRATIIEPPTVAGTFLAFDAATFDRITRCYTDTAYAGDSATLDLPLFLSRFEPWWYNGNEVGFARRRPYNLATWGSLGSPTGTVDVRPDIPRILYPNGTSDVYHHIATIVENPPAELRSNLGLQLLPACAWFQVEFLMPEDPRNGRDYGPGTLQLTGGNPPSQRQDIARWTSVDAGSTFVFVPDTAANRELVASEDPTSGSNVRWYYDFARLDPTKIDSVSNRRIRMWPYAIRITVRVFDPRGRLNEPIVRTLVHRFD